MGGCVHEPLEVVTRRRRATLRAAHIVGRNLLRLGFLLDDELIMTWPSCGEETVLRCPSPCYTTAANDYRLVEESDWVCTRYNRKCIVFYPTGSPPNVCKLPGLYHCRGSFSTLSSISAYDSCGKPES